MNYDKYKILDITFYENFPHLYMILNFKLYWP